MRWCKCAKECGRRDTPLWQLISRQPLCGERRSHLRRRRSGLKPLLAAPFRGLLGSPPCPAGTERTNRAAKNWAAWTVERAVSDRPGAVPSNPPAKSTRSPTRLPLRSSRRAPNGARARHTPGDKGACRVTINPLHTHVDAALAPAEAAKPRQTITPPCTTNRATGAESISGCLFVGS